MDPPRGEKIGVMAKKFTLRVEGLSRIEKKFGKIPSLIESETDAAIQAAGDDFVDRAVNDAPHDESLLRQGISKVKKGRMKIEVVSSAPYSAYIEFGTKKKTQIPADLAAYAAQFKGKGRGSYEEFLQAIKEWVKRKGIVSRYSVKTKKEIRNYSKGDNERLEQAARMIAISIMKNGIKAQPFFFKQRDPVFAQLMKNISPKIKKALEK